VEFISDGPYHNVLCVPMLIECTIWRHINKWWIEAFLNSISLLSVNICCNVFGYTIV